MERLRLTQNFQDLGTCMQHQDGIAKRLIYLKGRVVKCDTSNIETGMLPSLTKNSALITSVLTARCAAKPALLTLAFSSFSELTRMYSAVFDCFSFWNAQLPF